MTGIGDINEAAREGERVHDEIEAALRAHRIDELPFDPLTFDPIGDIEGTMQWFMGLHPLTRWIIFAALVAIAAWVPQIVFALR